MTSLNNSHIPERLLKGNRQPEQRFAPDERLFHRFNKMMKENKHLYPSSIRFPDFSVNREKLSLPEDVLLHEYPKYLKWGIVSFKVKDIPEPIAADNRTEYEFKVVHDPIDFNYAHSEVRTYKNGSYSQNMKISKLVKKAFRYKLSERLSIIKESEV